MKIYKKILLFLVITLCIISVKVTVYGAETTQKLYQDITINQDGSITIKEAALLSGEYNGRLRNIEFKNDNSTKFSGIYSNFTGNTDIYNGSEITNIKIADISEKNFKTISDINKIEKTYKQVSNASKGDYGVYTVNKSENGIKFQVYCKSSKNKIFYMEYTVKDAVVIHNDIAELYWNVMGTGYEENITDFQVIIHLPQEDSDVRIWSHGPLTGINSIVNKKTLSFKDINLKPYKAETVRLMFNKALVKDGTKKSGVNGKEYILKYETSQANKSNAAREKARLEQINEASSAVIELKEVPTIYSYNNALKYVNELSNSSKEKQDLLNEIYKLKNTVNSDWKNTIKTRIGYLDMKESYSSIKYDINSIEEYIQEGFDEEYKKIYIKQLEPYYQELAKKEKVIRTTSLTIVIILYLIGLVVAITTLIKNIKDKNAFGQKYYRDFPSDDNPYIVEYLIKHNITNISISATILNLIVKKVIKVEDDIVKNNKKEIILIKQDIEYSGTEAENTILYFLFNVVGTDNRCNLKEFQKFGKSENNARILTSEIESFKNQAENEAKTKDYFGKVSKKALKVIYIIFMYILSWFLTIGVFLGDGAGNESTYIFITLLLFSIYLSIVVSQKNRTEKGIMEYSKWMAHKKFLEDFSKFGEKELPEIILWERYLVTATVLGCADKVRKSMELKIADISPDNNYLYDMVLINHMSSNITSSISRAVNNSISTAKSTINIANSSDSSSGGSGGGSSFGGGRRWTVAVAVVVFKIKEIKEKGRKQYYCLRPKHYALEFFAFQRSSHFFFVLSSTG